MRRFVPICVWSLAALSLIGCGGQSARLSLLRQADLYGSSTAGDVDGTPVQARFANPANVEVGPDGAVYVADYDNDAVRMSAPDGYQAENRNSRCRKPWSSSRNRGDFQDPNCDDRHCSSYD